MQTRRHFAQTAAALSAAALVPFPALARAFEQVKILYGFPAGSAGDICARRVGDRFGGTAYSKNNGIVDTKAGAGGRIALEALKTAPADGSVLAMTPSSCMSLYPHIYKRLAYDPFADFVAVGTASMIHHGLAVGPLVPASVKTVQDFLVWARANPKDASYGSPAAGSTPHFIGALLGLNNHVDLKHVPYRGSVPGVTDMVGGQLAAMVTPHGDFIPNHKAGRLRILATSGKQRSPFVPEVPTFAEQGFADLTAEEWFGFYAPAKTPADVVATANAAINAAIQDKSVIDSLTVVGLIPYGGSAGDMALSQKNEYDRWGPLIRQIGFTAES